MFFIALEIFSWLLTKFIASSLEPHYLRIFSYQKQKQIETPRDVREKEDTRLLYAKPNLNAYLYVSWAHIEWYHMGKDKAFHSTYNNLLPLVIKLVKMQNQEWCRFGSSKTHQSSYKMDKVAYFFRADYQMPFQIRLTVMILD